MTAPFSDDMIHAEFAGDMAREYDVPLAMRYRIPFHVYKWWGFLHLFIYLIHGDVSYYHAHPDGTDFLTVRQAFEIARLVWLK